MTPSRWAWVVGLSAAAALVSGCGTTVPVTTTVQTGGSALHGAGSGNSLPDATAPTSTGGSPGGGSAPAGSGPGATAGAGGTSATGGEPGGSASVPRGDLPGSGAAAGSHGPLHIGFLVVDNSDIPGFGHKSGPDPQQGFKDMVSFLNLHGGLAGHRIEPVYHSINGGQGDASSNAQAACADLTQDHHVQLVVTAEWTQPTLEACLARAHVPHFDAGIAYNLDGAAQRQMPYYLAPATIGADRYEAVRLRLAVARGWLKRGDKVGVVLAGCQPYQRIYSDVVVPEARRLGLQIFSEEFQCNNGAQDLGGEVAQFRSAELRFRSEGVQTVMAVSPAESVIWVFFATYAQQQGYHPYYLLTSDALPFALAASQGGTLSFPAEDLPHVRGFGWNLIADSGPKAPAATAAQDARRAACKKMSPTMGGTTQQGDDGARSTSLFEYFEQCDTLMLIGRLLTATSGSTALPALNSSYARVAGSFVALSSVDARFRPTNGRHDAVSAVRPFGYDATCKCMKYVGPTINVQ